VETGSFIQSAVKTCSTGVQNAGFSADKVELICGCYANAMADNINASEIVALAAGQVPDSFREKAKSATLQCVSKAR
jgi:hypothetical protein